MNEEIERLEIRNAYLEAQVAELNEVVIGQQKSIDTLSLQLQSLAKKVSDLIEESGEARPSRRPPHY